MDPYLRRDPEYQSFVTVFRGFQYVGKVMESYTKAGLRRVHQAAYRANAGKPQCLQQCSRLHGKNTHMWCQTCKAWRNILTRSRTRPFTRWDITESWKWANDYEAIAPVFLPEFWTGDVRLDEFGTACHLWSTCHEFNIDRQLLKKLREFRNKHFGHNPDLKVTEVDKKRVFDALKMLLREIDVQRFVNVGQVHKYLDEIAKGDELNAFMDGIETGMQHIHKAVDTVSVGQKILAICMNVWFERVSRDIKQQSQKLDAMRHTRDNEKRLFKRLFKGSIFCVLLLTSAWVLDRQFGKQRDTITASYRSHSNCMSEMYSYPFPQDLPLLPYLMEHSRLIGRTWLIGEIKAYVEHANSSDRGVIITADMGYGKSALVKHLLCANKYNTAYNIRLKVAAFHVCRFDVPATRDPHRFIYRLVGFLSTRFPEFGGILSELPDTALLFDENKCRNNIFACFDQGILFPLLEMKTADSEPQVVIVDALDECYDQRLNDNEIGQLLKARYRKLPVWVKFILTSRPTDLTDSINNIKRFYLDQNDHRNIADIKQYIEYKATLHPQLHHIKKEVDRLLDKSEGIFLFAVHFIEYLITNSNNSIDKFPSTLDGVYEMNFERTFQSVDEFIDAKEILEVIVASLHPLSLDELKSILDNTNVSHISHTKEVLKKLSFCFRATKEVTLVHQSLNAWLISEDNKSFRILASRGHAILSRYLLKHRHEDNGPLDIVNIAIHIGSSNDHTLSKAFGSVLSSKNVTKATLHKLIWKSDSVAALELILNLQVGVDSLNEGNVTPAFIAAARGHLGQLKLLKSKGADLNFKVNDAYLISSPIQIDEIKHHYFFGYGLIHIASQFGHLNIVNYLLNHNASMINSTTGPGLSVSDVACEYGHLRLLESIFSKYEINTDKCLYYAAKNGHTNIIEAVALHGKNITCISRDDALDALNIIRNLDPTKKVLQTTTPVHLQRLITMNDLWWKVYQESPLHASIMTKYENTSITVINRYPHLTECVDAFGRTPFLLSVQENNTKIVERLSERIGADTCHYALDVTMFGIIPKTSMCPAGGTYAHLDGLYGRFDMTKILLNKGMRIDWLAKDNHSITAAHYAACNGNTLFLIFSDRVLQHTFSSIRSDNQSTPYHSSAICGSFSAFHALTYEGLSQNINRLPNVVDSENKSVLHYLVARKFTELIAARDFEKQKTYLHIFLRAQMLDINITSTDSFGRNILHYALKNGHYRIVLHLTSSSTVSFGSLLLKKDINGYTPIEYAIYTHDHSPYIEASIPIESDYYDIFTKPLIDVDQFVSSWDLGLLLALQAGMKVIEIDLCSNVLTDIILKSHCMTAAYLSYFNHTINIATLRKHVIESIPQNPPPVSLGAIARYRPQVFSRCGKLLSRSPLHLIAYKYNADMLMSNMRFLNLAFRSKNTKSSLSCSDRKGYNSFHYAIMGGNILMAIRLYEIGVAITNKKVAVSDIPWMILLAKERRQITHFRDMCNGQLSCMDHLLHKIFKRYIGNAILLSDICSNNSSGLSLVHIIAASGLTKSMDLLLNAFGRDIIACRNRDKINSFYLWDIFNNQTASQIFNYTIREVPAPETEALLILGILNDFPAHIFNNDKLSCAYNINRLSSQKLTKCIFMLFRNLKRILKKDCKFLVVEILEAIRTQERLSKALFSKDGNIDDALIYVKIRAGVFEQIFKSDRFRISFNYPKLKRLIHNNKKDTRCRQKRHSFVSLVCIQLYNEFNHAVTRAIALIKNIIMNLHYAYTVQLETAVFHLRINAIENTEIGTLRYMYSRAKFKKSRSELLFDKLLTEKQLNHIFRQSYLRVLKKTVKYQYIRETALSLINGPLTSYDFKYFRIEDAQTVPKPFEDILSYINSSSYAISK